MSTSLWLKCVQPAWAAVFMFAVASSAIAGDLRVVVNGLSNTQGTVNICLWQTDNGFPDCQRDLVFRHAIVKAPGASLVWTFAGIPEGSYAVSVAHDQNGDGKVERHWLFGYPTEGVGVSNITEALKRAPRFDEARFSAESALNEITVKMFYPE